MKNGRKPSYQERKILEANGFDPMQWLVIRVLAHSIQIRHRDTCEVREVSSKSR